MNILKISPQGLRMTIANIFRTPRQQHIAIAHYQLDEIYNTLKGIADDWDKKTIPLNIIEVTFKAAQPSINTGNKFLDKSNMAYNNALDSLYIELKKIAKKMHSKSVPLNQVKIGLDFLKSAYKDKPKNSKN